MPKYSLEDAYRQKAQDGFWNKLKNYFYDGLVYAIAEQSKPQGVATTYSTTPSNNSYEKERKAVAKNVINGANSTAANISNFIGDAMLRFMTAPPSGTATTAYTFPQYQFSDTDRQSTAETIAPVTNALSPSQWGGVLVDAVTGQEINMPWSGKQTGMFGDSGIGQLLNLGLDFYVGGKGTKKLNHTIRSLKGDNVYFIRNVGDIPTVDANGNFYASPQGNALANFTWDKSFRTHKHYRNRPGSEYMIFPNNLMKGKRFMSTDPMDTFIANDIFPANEVTIVSGNPEQLALAKQRGFKTLTTEELQKTLRESKKSPGISLKKDGKMEVYDAAANKVIRENFGRLSAIDAYGLRRRTGVNPHLNSRFRLKYHPSSPIESDMAKQFNFPQHPSLENLPAYRIQEILDALGSKPY